MIRKLMASSALLALMSAGAISVAQAEDTATTPAVVQGGATHETGKMAANDKLVPDHPTLATAFIGRSVYANQQPDAESIGDVNDLIIGDDGAITDAVVGVGGFLGIGEKAVAVPFDQLQVVEKDGEIRLIYAATREQLEAAPAVDLASYDPAARFSEQQQAQTDAMAPADQTAQQNVASADNMQADTMQTPAYSGDVAFMSADKNQIRASTLVGKEVYGADDQSIGGVSDLVLEKDGGTRVALIDVGGFLGIGEKTVAVPFDELHFAQAENGEAKVTVAMSKEQLEQMPTYEPVDRLAQAPMSNTEGDNTAADNMAAAETPAMAPAAGDQPAPADQMAATPNRITTSAIPDTMPTFDAQEVSASELIGTRVYGSEDADLGEVSDVVFDPSGKIDAVVVDVGGFLGIGEKPVALDFKTLNIRVDQGGNLIVVANATKDQLDQAPSYEVTMR